MILAIIQTLPLHPAHVVRTDTFAKFQRFCGQLEQQSYFAGHAACHATMNGIERTLAADADISDMCAIQKAADALFEAGPWDALVLPGLTDLDLQKAVCDICQPHLDAFDFRLFLDPPPLSDVATILRHQQSLPRFATYAWPWVSTVTPGRRSAERLPPSCLIAPLALGTAQYLRGVHDLEPSPDHAVTLHEKGVEVMVNTCVQRRTVVSRLAPQVPSPKPSEDLINTFVEIADPNAVRLTDPVQSKMERDEAAIEAMLLDTINQRCDAILRQGPLNNAGLWNALKRTATSVLMDAKSRGLITQYHVRCDEETASWGTPTAPVVEILIGFPKRVKQLNFMARRMP